MNFLLFTCACDEEVILPIFAYGIYTDHFVISE